MTTKTYDRPNHRSPSEGMGYGTFIREPRDISGQVIAFPTLLKGFATFGCPVIEFRPAQATLTVAPDKDKRYMLVVSNDRDYDNLINNTHYVIRLPRTQDGIWPTVSKMVIPSLIPEQSEINAGAADVDRRTLSNELYRAFENEPFENGIAHPAEQIIERALMDSRTLDWFVAYCTDEFEPGFAASVLRCLGRQTQAGNDSWRNDLVRAALASSDIEIRDAAVQAAESWGGEGIVDILKSHEEPETWIREYIEDVIEDLGA